MTGYGRFSFRFFEKANTLGDSGQSAHDSFDDDEMSSRLSGSWASATPVSSPPSTSFGFAFSTFSLPLARKSMQSRSIEGSIATSPSFPTTGFITAARSRSSGVCRDPQRENTEEACFLSL